MYIDTDQRVTYMNVWTVGVTQIIICCSKNAENKVHQLMGNVRWNVIHNLSDKKIYLGW
jgi:hypothetical protein